MIKRFSVWISLYAKGIWAEFTRQSGALSVAALILAAGSQTKVPQVSVTLQVLGWALAAFVFVSATYFSWPKFPKSIASAVTNRTDIPIEELTLYPMVPKIAIVGVSSVGKSTLRELLFNEEHSEGVSFSAGGRAIRLGPDDGTVAILLDGPGSSMQRQYEMAERADVICVVLDHSIAQDEAVSDVRLEQHATFFASIRQNLAAEWSKAPPSRAIKVHLLMNKRDLWEQSKAQQGTLEKFLEAERSAWAAVRYVEPVTVANHSSTFTVDMVNVRKALDPFNTAEVAGR